MDHDLVTLTPCTLGFISHSTVKALNMARPNIAASFWRETLVDAAIFREWIANTGRRAALVRMAHLLSELLYRLKAIGRATDGTIELPITQSELGDCLAISTVHVNRMLQQLRKDGLLTAGRGSFHILNTLRLIELGQFDPTYLHQQPQA